MKSSLLHILKILFISYVVLCVAVYFFQEKLIFFPEKLSKNFAFSFSKPFEEIFIVAQDNTSLHGILFTTDSARGVIIYLHGNAGSLRSWGEAAVPYVDLQYDLFMPDYRGYGKSEGTIRSEEEFSDDLQAMYDHIKTKYDEKNIIIAGYSLGTGPAAKLASTNHPRLLLLQAPYYSMRDLVLHHYPILPTFLLKYRFETNVFVKECSMPIIIFHGDDDEVIPIGSSLKLKELLKSTDDFIILHGQEHNGMNNNPEYLTAIKKIISP